MKQIRLVKIKQVFPAPSSGNVQRAMLPIVMADDREAVEAALKSLAAVDTAVLRGAAIKNTLEHY